jgi:beta-glucanase (GH16 family)
MGESGKMTTQAPLAGQTNEPTPADDTVDVPPAKWTAFGRRWPIRPWLALVIGLVLLLLAASAGYVVFQRQDGVHNGNAAYDANGWSAKSDVGTTSIRHVRVSDGPSGISTAAEIRRPASAQGRWALATVQLRDPTGLLKVGQGFRLRAFVRNLAGTRDSIGMLLANQNYQHRPTADSRYDALSDTSWHELALTFVVTSQGAEDTQVYFALPPSGALHWQITGVSLRSVHDVPKTATATDHAKVPSQTLSFDGPAGAGLDASVWSHQEGGGGWGNDERQTYTSSQSNASLDGNGNLIITARREDATGKDGIRRHYTSARLTTEDKLEVPPGSYVEAPIRASVGKGVWPAFWMMGTSYDRVGWPACGEIDIVEVLGSQPSVVRSRLHLASAHNPQKDVPLGVGSDGASTTLPHSLDQQTHKYGVYFDDKKVTFYVDHLPTATFTAAYARSRGRTWPFGKPQFLLLNVAVGGLESPKKTVFPRTMTVGTISIWHSGVPF